MKRASRSKVTEISILSWYLQLTVAVQIILIISILVLLLVILTLCMLIVLNPTILDHIAKLWTLH